MEDSFFYLPEYLREFQIAKISNSGSRIPIDTIGFIHDTEICSDENCLYLGYLSESGRLSSGATAILVEDTCGKEAARLPARYVILKDGTELERVYLAAGEFLKDGIAFHRRANELMEMLFQKRDLREIICSAGEILQMKLVLADSLLKILCTNLGCQENGPLWENYISSGYVPDIRWLKDTDQCEPVFVQRTIKAYAYRREGQQSDHLAVILSDGVNTLATLCITKELGPFSRLELRLIGIFAEVQLNYLQHKTLMEMRHTRSMSFEYAFRPVFMDKHINWVEFRHNAEQAGFEFAECYALLLVDFFRNTPVDQSRNIIRTYLEEVLPTQHSIIVEEDLVFVLGFPDEEAFIGWDRSKLLNVLEEYNLYAATSRIFSDLKEIRRHFENTRHILEHFYCAPEGIRLLSADTMGILYVVETLMRAGQLEDFLEPKILKLQEYDAKNHTSYLKTLYAYLRHSRKPLLACNDLHIHRNTLDYRIQRIEEMIHVNWNDGDEAFRLFLSLSILYYKEKIDAYQSST